MINRRRSGARGTPAKVNATAGLEASEGVNSASVSDGSHESVHLCPNGTPVRLQEASYLFGYAAPEGYAVIGGDFNSLAPGDDEPADLARLPAHFRARYVDGDGKMDRRPIASLLQAGFVDLGAQHGDRRRTVPGAGFPLSEFVDFRSDYLLASAALTKQATVFSTIDCKEAGEASDHYPIYADFKMSKKTS
ncbi:hypothetical protein [Sphingobium yanoikuyae]|uniref:hypothetical protein n=1 Tax=Sphingobium yanoikuyae TaxID=13690 RepID=UPI0035C6901D